MFMYNRIKTVYFSSFFFVSFNVFFSMFINITFIFHKKKTKIVGIGIVTNIISESLKGELISYTGWKL